MFENLEKSDHVEAFAGMGGAKLFGTHGHYTRQTVVLPSESHGVLVQLDSRDVESCIPGRSEKISHAAADVEQTAASWGLRVAQETAMTRLKRHRGAIAALIGAFVPAGVRHRDGVPEMKVACSAGKELRSMEHFERRIPGGLAASWADCLLLSKVCRNIARPARWRNQRWIS